MKNEGTSEEATQSTTPGRLGRYAIVGTLARGGMGEVLRARSFGAEGVAKELCIKRIHADRLAAPGALTRFVAEAKVSLRLSHGNIVSVFDFGRADHEYYLAMEWVDGADLQTLLRADTALSPMACAHACAEVARALSYAHGAGEPGKGGVVHCDVKPANILVSRSGDVKLADFGVSSAVQGGGGTRGYMPPEQERGEVSPAVDVYALGMVLGQMLTTELPSPGAALAGAPSDLNAVFARATASAAGDRIASAQALADLLDDYVAKERVKHGGSPRAELARLVAGSARSAEAGPVVATLSFAGESATLTRVSTQVSAAAPKRSARAGLIAAALLLALGVIGVMVGFQRRSAAEGSLEPDSDLTTAATDSEAEPESETDSDSEAETGSEAEPETEAEPDSEAEAETETEAESETESGAESESETDSAPGSGVAGGARAAPLAPGILRINAIPWAEVELDGRALGTTPLLGVEVAPGRHVLRFRNPALDATLTRDVEVAPAERRDVVVDLTQ